MTNLNRLIALSALSLLAPSAMADDAVFLRGDADSNGTVEMTDAIMVVDWLFQGGEEPYCLDAADANDDGAVDISDAILVLDSLYKGAVLPGPTDDAGYDLTDDELDCLDGLPIVDEGAQCGDTLRVEAYGYAEGPGSCTAAGDEMEIDALSQLECPSSCPAEIAHGDGLYHMECRVVEAERWAEVTVVCGE